MSWVYDTVCCTLNSCTMYDQRSVAYTNKNILFVSHVVYQSRTIRIIHEYTERYGGYNNTLGIFSVCSRGDSGPMSHSSDYSPLHVNSHSCISQKVHRLIEPLYRLITGINLIGCFAPSSVQQLLGCFQFHLFF